VVAGIAGALLAVPVIAMSTAVVRSLLAPGEPPPTAVNPLDPLHGRPGPGEPGQRRRLRMLVDALSRRLRAARA
jgi:hypothetical protein